MIRSFLFIFLLAYALCSPIRFIRSPGQNEKPTSSSSKKSDANAQNTSTISSDFNSSNASLTTLPQTTQTNERTDSTASSKCYFAEKRRGILELSDRPTISQVSSECNTEFSSMHSLITEEVKELYGATNALDLILCRGAGLCDLDFSKNEVTSEWKDRKICKLHLDELLWNWEKKGSNHMLYKKSSPKPTCSMPDDIGFQHKGHRPIATQNNNKRMYKDDSFAVLKKFGILVHPGTPICDQHKWFVTHIDKTEREEKPIEQVDDGLEECSNGENDDEYTPRRSSSNEPQTDGTCSKLKLGFLQFAKAAEVKRILPSSKPFESLDRRTKQRKVCMARKLIDRMFDLIAPTAKNELKQMVMPDNEDMWIRKRNDKFGKLMNYIAEAYRLADNRAERYIVLSLIAHAVPLSQIRAYIPGLTYHIYNVARQYRRVSKETRTRKSERYNPVALNFFIEFITSNVIMSPFTFGSKKTRYSNGALIELPKIIRKQTATEIIAMFKQYLKEEDREQFLMSDSTYYRILDVCVATTQKASTCVDYYLADGIEAGDQIKVILGKWKSSKFLDDDLHDQLSRDLEEAIHYFRTDYGLHVKEDSRIPDHCARYALSDDSDPKFTSKCQHRHDLKCERCESADNVFRDIQNFIDDLVSSLEFEYNAGGTVAMLQTLESFREDKDNISDCLEKPVEMKKHILRSEITDKQRATVVQKLDENEGLITLDFAQKLLPQKYRERQTDYFGKRGMSYHISHITANISKQVVTHSFVHLLRGELQDSDAVSSIIKHILQELEKMGMKKVYLRSDNAGAYHCASTIGSLNDISKSTNVVIAQYLFSEPQNGKSSCDRVASLVKRKVHTWVDAGNDVTDVDQFYLSLTSKKPLSGTSVFLARIERPAEKNHAKNQIENISILFDFVFSRDSIRAFRYNGLGTGQLLKTATLTPNTAHLIIERSGGFLSHVDKSQSERMKIANNEETEFWYSKKCAANANCINEPMEFADVIVDESQQLKDVGYFHCPSPGCSATYRNYKNLEKHQTIGKHNAAPEKITLIDHALLTYSTRLEDLGSSKEGVPNAIDEAMNVLEETTNDETLSLSQGWALRVRKMSGRFSIEVRTYLSNLFEEGERTGRKYDGKQVAKMMREEKNSDGTRKFQSMNRLNERQINSFFSRLAQKKNYDSSVRTVRTSGLPVNGDDTKTEDEEDELSDDYELVYLKDPLYSTSLDIELRKVIIEEKDNIFDSNLDVDIDNNEVESKLKSNAKHAKISS